MKQFILLTLMSLVPVMTWSQQKVLVDGIYFFLNDSSLTAEVTNDESYPYSGDVVIPASVDYNNLTYSVTSIGSSAFYECTGLTSIDIPESVVTIGEFAFYGSGLSSVVFPDHMNIISEGAFSLCSNLKFVTIPPSVTIIGDAAFAGCTALERVNISDLAAWCNIEFANPHMDFYPNAPFDDLPLYLNGEPVSEIVIPEALGEIKGASFYNCKSLTSVYIPDNSVSYIARFAFGHCDNLSFVVLGKGLHQLGLMAFEESWNIRTLIFKDENPPLAPNIPMVFYFSGTTVYVPDVSAYTEGGYYYNPFLDLREPGAVRDFIRTPEGICFDWRSNNVITTDYFDVTDPMEVKIPQTIECDGVSYTVKGIRRQAFEINRSVTSISLPGTLTTVEDLAFHKCTGLTEMYCYAEEVPATSETAFEGSNAQEAILYVPAASVESYRASYPWNTFKEIRPITTTAIDQLNVIGENNDAQKETFRLDGQRVTDLSLLPSGSIVVVRKGEKFEKVMVK